MLPHTLITASAGSGKTWRLTVRYLRLVMMGAAPESIAALTFSRKAAGEFFNAILHRLAEAAGSVSEAGRLAADIGMPEKNTADFCQALEQLVSRLPFLMLGTLDSFFIRLARSFPFELGISGDFTLLDDHQLSVEKLRVYERVFAPDERTDEARMEFRRAFTEATFGKDEIRVRALLDDFIDAWHYHFLATPDPDRWGNPHRIWPVKPPVPGPGLDRASVIQRIRKGLERVPTKGKHVDRWNDFLEAAAVHLPGSPMAKPMEYLWDRLLPLLEGLDEGAAILKMDRTQYDLEGPLAEAVWDLLRQIIAGELAAVLRQTRGIHEVVRRYDEAYHTLVRRQGRWTFHDVQLILAGGLNPEGSGSEARAARLLTHQENRQLMDYRLDARYEHWLLDEFQDTSRVQWRVLANLMDEAIQDSEGRRSFFAVGDQKQSIYEWRGGTPALFDELQAQYNLPHLPPEQWPLQVEPLALSQRSGPAVIEMVNQLLGDPGALLESGLPPATVAKWPWQPPGSKNQHQGTAVVIEVDPKVEEADERFPDIAATWKRAAELLMDIKPLKRRLTCAVICHRNDRALEITNFLRAATGMPVVCESDLSIASDNPATSALLALLQFAAHPGDQFAWQHLMMTPLATIMQALPHTPDPDNNPRQFPLRRAVVRQVLEQVAERGFHDTLRWWSEALQEKRRREYLELDAFSRGRLDELCGCARQFDATGSRDVDEFLTFAASWTERGASHDGAIQVMTVHRSKGLTFDVVVIPDLGYPYTFINRFTMGQEMDACGDVQWLTKLPNKDIAEADPVLRKALERANGAVWGERLAGLYVMVTRAKYANYLLIPPGPKEPGKSPSLAATVRHMLTMDGAGELEIAGRNYPLLARYGDAAWYLEKPLPATSTSAIKTPAFHGLTKSAVQTDLFMTMGTEETTSARPPARKMIPLLLKRASQDDGLGEEALFQTARHAAQEAGIAIHAAFQRIAWLDGAGAALSGPGLEAEAVAEVRACLREPALAEFFEKPEGPAEVWRERAFESVRDGVRHSGIFDRVIVRRVGAGHATAALLVDFKTGPVRGSIRDAALAHRQQLTVYRGALSQLLRLKEEQIRAVVLFTATREVVDL